MKPKGKLLVLVLIVGAVALAAATGAFTTVEAERTVNVDVAGDDSALLQIQAAAGAEEYVDTSGDQTVIDVDQTNEGGEGINVNARTSFGPVLNITNQGTQDVGIRVELTGDNSTYVDVEWIDPDDGTSVGNATSAEDLDVGTTIQLSLAIELRDSGVSSADDLDLDLTIIADADEHSDA